MQYLKFHGRFVAKNSANNNNFPVGIEYRTDLIDGDHNGGQNLTILSQVLDHDALKDEHEEFFGSTFRVNGVYTISQFTDFATANALTLTIKNSDGSDKTTLIDADSSGSSSN